MDAQSGQLYALPSMALIDCKPVAQGLAAQVGGVRHGATAEAQVYCSISDVNWSKAGHTVSTVIEAI